MDKLLIPTTTGPVLPRIVARALFLFGPVLTGRFLEGQLTGGLMVDQLPLALLVMVVLAWSPLPLMLPAVILQDAAEEVGHHPLSGPWKTLRSQLAVGSSVRTEAALALTGWLAGIVWALPHLVR
jgi:hypothetical protein